MSVLLPSSINLFTGLGFPVYPEPVPFAAGGTETEMGSPVDDFGGHDQSAFLTERKFNHDPFIGCRSKDVIPTWDTFLPTIPDLEQTVIEPETSVSPTDLDTRILRAVFQEGFSLETQGKLIRSVVKSEGGMN
jgi:hypothetical protein